MSLNGLDDNAVVRAHSDALSDLGGWFFLKYSNRDTVELLSRGNGGVAEAKDAVDQYHEKSPLYGMVQYRRKRVLLKYVPDGTSRLLQVRLTVQFQSILDAFPHDTIFSFTTAAELVESALGLCTMLLPTTVGSLQPSDSSLRQRRLNEISEDVEEPVLAAKTEEPRFARLLESIDNGRVSESDDLSRLPASALRAKALLAKRKQENLSLSLSQSSSSLQILQSTTQPTSHAETPSVIAAFSPPVATSSQSKYRDDGESIARIEADHPELPPLSNYHSRHLSETESASISQWNDQVMAYSLPEPKPPKKKLAPRPHVDTTNRPRTANTYDEGTPPRPVANLPTSIRVSNRPNPATITRPGSQQSSRSVPARFTQALDLPPPLPDLAIHSMYKNAESRKAGSVASATTDIASAISPEKLRLMKALQNRKRNQMLTNRAASAQSNLTILHDDFPLGVHPPEKPTSSVQIRSTIHEEARRPLPEIKRAHESSTASPTSITSISEDPSTRPSSFAEERESPASQKSSPHDTDSSSTPKAIVAIPQIATEPDLEHTQTKPDAPTISLMLEEQSRPRHSNTSTIHAPSAQHAQSRRAEQPAFSWLASDKEVERLQVLAAESPLIEQNRNSHLSVNGLGSPTTECSSVVSDDDPLVEELRKATVHEATSMSVIRPPLTPTMRTYSHDRSRATTMTGTILTPQSSRSGMDFAENTSPQPGSRNTSTALPQMHAGGTTEPAPMSLVKKAALGNGISKRIKALEDSTRNGNTSSAIPQDSTSTRSTLTNMMKRNSFISQFQGSNTLADKPVQQTATYNPGKLGTAAPQSPRTQTSAGLSSHTPSHHDRQHSATVSSSIPWVKDTVTDNSSTSAQDRKRFSFASYRSGTTSQSNGKWMQPESMSSHVSLNNKDARKAKVPRSETSSVNEEKRTSRATRLMKRVSGFGTRFGGKAQQRVGSRDDTRHYSTIMEQNEPSTYSESMAESTMQMVDIGDVNVQFPETLLWKRRFLRIDDQGYLVFQAPTDSQNIRATSRKFHLADIQEPCLPDSEREEIAWSVLLDLRDGNCVQCACESKQGQSLVLKMLLDAHSAYHSLYPDALK